MALTSLEVSFGLNIIICVAYYTYIWPNQGKDYDASSLEEAFGKNILTDSYFLVRNLVVHTVPLLFTLISVFITDVVFLETDYLLIILTTIIYVFTNFVTCKYADDDQLYYLNWETVAKISPYSPIFASVAFDGVAIAGHLGLSMATQMFHNRYESEMGTSVDNTHI